MKIPQKIIFYSSHIPRRMESMHGDYTCSTFIFRCFKSKDPNMFNNVYKTMQLIKINRYSIIK